MSPESLLQIQEESQASRSHENLWSFNWATHPIAILLGRQHRLIMSEMEELCPQNWDIVLNSPRDWFPTASTDSHRLGGKNDLVSIELIEQLDMIRPEETLSVIQYVQRRNEE
jgi:hypothetical protein